MKVVLSRTKKELGEKAADWGAEGMREAIRSRGSCNMVIPTGASQFEMIDALVSKRDIDWSKVSVFHLDEYGVVPKVPARALHRTIARKSRRGSRGQRRR
jgi:glucosamine-6-phosphate deaminase